MALKSRASVRYDTIAPRGLVILGILMSASEVLGRNLEITSACDSHALPDPHARGEAYDISILDMTAEQILTFYRYMVERLGPAFTVLIEAPKMPASPLIAKIATINPKATGLHCHIQPKKGL
jgi:hypothetical protein